MFLIYYQTPGKRFTSSHPQVLKRNLKKRGWGWCKGVVWVGGVVSNFALQGWMLFVGFLNMCLFNVILRLSIIRSISRSLLILCLLVGCCSQIKVLYLVSLSEFGYMAPCFWYSRFSSSATLAGNNWIIGMSRVVLAVYFYYLRCLSRCRLNPAL